MFRNTASISFLHSLLVFDIRFALVRIPLFVNVTLARRRFSVMMSIQSPQLFQLHFGENPPCLPFLCRASPCAPTVSVYFRLFSSRKQTLVFIHNFKHHQVLHAVRGECLCMVCLLKGFCKFSTAFLCSFFFEEKSFQFSRSCCHKNKIVSYVVKVMNCSQDALRCRPRHEARLG